MGTVFKQVFRGDFWGGNATCFRLFRFVRGNKRSLDSNFHNLKICRQAAQPKGANKPKKLRPVVAVQQAI